MDLSPALEWHPPGDWRSLTVIESHTGGEPFRVVVDGLPEIPGDSVLERRRYASEHLDDLRRSLMWEPRGHADMYGGWIGPPVEPDSHLSVLFLHNEGFSTMCGHGIIALTKVVLETGIMQATGDETMLRIDTPAGLVTATADTSEGTTGEIRFVNVPSFAVDLDASVEVPGLGEVRYDIGYGGAFYAYVEAAEIGLTLDDVSALVVAGRAIKRAVAEHRSLEHPADMELGFLYGVILTGPPRDPANHSRNVCIFADGEVDRSPTGTGVSGRLAILHARGAVGPGNRVTIESITGSKFGGHIVGTTKVGEIDAIVPEISGSAHIVGKSELWVDPSDPLNPGFFIR